MSVKEKLMQSPILHKASHWYYSQSERDQNALKLLALALLVIGLYLLVWLPAQNFAARARADADREQRLLQWLQQNQSVAREIAARSATGATPGDLRGQSLLSVVGGVAKTHGIELRRFEPEGDTRMRVWLEKVPFNQMLLWLDGLAKQYGIQVEQISVERSDAPGIVTARLTLALS